MTFPVLAALLCLGQKYEIRKLQVEARRRIYAQYPTTLDELKDWVGFNPPAYFRSPKVLAIARRAGLLSILPRVFYTCCVLYKWSDITHENSSAPLSPVDQIACLAGYRAICQAQAETTFAWAYIAQTLAATCATHER